MTGEHVVYSFTEVDDVLSRDFFFSLYLGVDKEENTLWASCSLSKSPKSQIASFGVLLSWSPSTLPRLY